MRNCIICGSSFSTGGTRLCSDACRELRKKQQSKKHFHLYKSKRLLKPFIEMACKCCGNRFLTNRKRHFFCSNKCLIKDFYERKKAKNPKISHKKECKCCGSEFETVRVKSKFCSKKCRTKTRDRRRAHNPAKARRHYLKNRTRLIEYQKQYVRERITKDPVFKIRINLRHRIRSKVKAMKPGKSGSCNLVGCDLETLRQHLESKFRNGMSWLNYGTVWVVDHIRPLSSFNLLDLEERKMASHYTNLQPLGVAENLSKSDKWDQQC